MAPDPTRPSPAMLARPADRAFVKGTVDRAVREHARKLGDQAKRPGKHQPKKNDTRPPEQDLREWLLTHPADCARRRVETGNARPVLAEMEYLPKSCRERHPHPGLWSQLNWPPDGVIDGEC